MKTCAGCAHFKPIDGGGGVGDCRRYPPTLLVVMESIGQDSPHTEFPEVAEDWKACGEWKENAPPQPISAVDGGVIAAAAPGPFRFASMAKLVGWACEGWRDDQCVVSALFHTRAEAEERKRQREAEPADRGCTWLVRGLVRVDEATP